MFKLCPWVTGESHIAELSGRPNLVTYRRQCKHFWKEKSRTNHASGSSGLGPSLSFTNLSFKRPHLSRTWKIPRDPSHDLSSSSGALFQTSKPHSFVGLTVCAAMTSNSIQETRGQRRTTDFSQMDRLGMLSRWKTKWYENFFFPHDFNQMFSFQKDCTNLRPIVISLDEESIIPRTNKMTHYHLRPTKTIELATGTHRTQNACLLIFWRSDHVAKLSAHVERAKFWLAPTCFLKKQTFPDTCLYNWDWQGHYFRASFQLHRQNAAFPSSTFSIGVKHRICPELLRHSYPKCPLSPKSPTLLGTR